MPVETSLSLWLCWRVVDTAPTHNRLDIIADDLTGAADSGDPETLVRLVQRLRGA